MKTHPPSLTPRQEPLGGPRGRHAVTTTAAPARSRYGCLVQRIHEAFNILDNIHEYIH